MESLPWKVVTRFEIVPSKDPLKQLLPVDMNWGKSQSITHCGQEFIH